MAQLRVGPFGDLWPSLGIRNRVWLNSVERTKSEEAERGGGRISEKRENGAMITLILSFTYVIFNIQDVAISPKYNFEKLQRKLTISDFHWLKTYRVWCIVLLIENPLKCLEWTIGTIKAERCLTAKFIQVNIVKLSHLTWIIFLYTLNKLTFFFSYR